MQSTGVNEHTFHLREEIKAVKLLYLKVDFFAIEALSCVLRLILSLENTIISQRSFLMYYEYIE